MSLLLGLLVLFVLQHWLLFDALTKPRGDAVRSLDGRGEPQWDISALQRYAIESKLALLLDESVRVGYTDVKDGSDVETSSKAGSKGKSLLDLADENGNTPLVSSARTGGRAGSTVAQ